MSNLYGLQEGHPDAAWIIPTESPNNPSQDPEFGSKQCPPGNTPTDMNHDILQTQGLQVLKAGLFGPSRSKNSACKSPEPEILSIHLQSSGFQFSLVATEALDHKLFWALHRRPVRSIFPQETRCRG